MQEEVTQKTVTLCAYHKMTADVLEKWCHTPAASKETKKIAEKKAQKNQPETGKITVKAGKKQNAGMTDIEILPRTSRSFERYARKLGINYA